MTTRLDKLLKREVVIEGVPYTLTVSPTGFKLVRKGRRKGLELEWAAVVSGDAALAAALNASLRAGAGGGRPRHAEDDGPAKRLKSKKPRRSRGSEA